MKIGFYSAMTGIPWGASEYLWSQAAQMLQQRGHTIGINFQRQWRCPQPLADLRSHGGNLFWRYGPIDQVRNKLTGELPWEKRHRQWLQQFSPDFFLISAGSHTDDVSIGSVACQMGIPFATLVHCASTRDWIEGEALERYRQTYLHARQCYFVSQENCDILEIHLAAALPQAKVVENPLKVNLAEPLPWPESSPPWRLACVARLGCWQKGQDLILEVLKQPQWRDRPIEVTFWGQDHGNQRQLEDLVQMYGLQSQFRFGGFASPLEIWRQSHALLLPSRYEGMPMVTAEAMMCGRIAIVTACGRNPEWVDEGATGFLAIPTVVSLSEALERAWSRRHDWQSMGVLAAQRIRDRYSSDPVTAFADRLEG